MIMVGASNRKIEEHYFEMFRQDYSLPVGKVIYGDKPDVVIKGLSNIGIEITNFYLEDGGSNESEQVQRVLRENTISRAQKLYLKDNGRNITIVFGFDEKRPIQAKNKNGLEKKLADLAKRVEKMGEGSISREAFKGIPELSFIYLIPREHQDAKWQVCQVYSGQKMSRNRLLKKIQDKEGKIAQYKKCDVYWLVLVIDFFDRAQDQEIKIKDFDKIKSEKFEKIFVYRTAMRQVLEVK